MYVYSLISQWFQQTSQFTPLVIELSLIRSHLLWGEFSAFLQLIPLTNVQFRSTRYPSLLGGQRQYGMRSLPDTSTHDQQWKLNPRPSDLESNILSTGYINGWICGHVHRWLSERWIINSGHRTCIERY